MAKKRKNKMSNESKQEILWAALAVTWLFVISIGIFSCSSRYEVKSWAEVKQTSCRTSIIYRDANDEEVVCFIRYSIKTDEKINELADLIDLSIQQEIRDQLKTFAAIIPSKKDKPINFDSFILHNLEKSYVIKSNDIEIEDFSLTTVNQN